MSSVAFAIHTRGRSASPEVAALIEKISYLHVDQGFVIPKGLRVTRGIKVNGKKYTLHTYKGYNTVFKFAKAHDVRYRTKLDINGKLWIFRVEPLDKAA
jgi:hypothetical protein